MLQEEKEQEEDVGNDLVSTPVIAPTDTTDSPIAGTQPADDTTSVDTNTDEDFFPAHDEVPVAEGFGFPLEPVVLIGNAQIHSNPARLSSIFSSTDSFLTAADALSQGFSLEANLNQEFPDDHPGSMNPASSKEGMVSPTLGNGGSEDIPVGDDHEPVFEDWADKEGTLKATAAGKGMVQQFMAEQQRNQDPNLEHNKDDSADSDNSDHTTVSLQDQDGSSVENVENHNGNATVNSNTSKDKSSGALTAKSTEQAINGSIEQKDSDTEGSSDGQALIPEGTKPLQPPDGVSPGIPVNKRQKFFNHRSKS